MKNLQLSGTENVWIDEENGFIQFWSGSYPGAIHQEMIEYPIEFAIPIMDFLKENEELILSAVNHFQMEDRDESWEGDEAQP